MLQLENGSHVLYVNCSHMYDKQLQYQGYDSVVIQSPTKLIWLADNKIYIDIQTSIYLVRFQS